MGVDNRIRSKQIDELFEVILSLRNREECYRFFEDICTVGELNSLAQRLAVAKKIDNGQKYSQIVDETGASTATISRVKKYLNYGADGYRLVLDRLGNKRRNKSKKQL